MNPSSPLYVLHAPPILLFFSDTPNIAQKVFRAQFLCTLFTTLLWWQLMTAIERIRTVIPAYNGTARDRNFFSLLKQVPFNTSTWSLDPRYSKYFLLKTGFRYAQVPLTTGLIVFEWHLRR
jgi:hypothetical protein